MTELFLMIIAGCIVALFAWLLKMSYGQRKFRTNCLNEIKIELEKLKVEMKNMKEDVDALSDRLTKHLDGLIK